MGIMSMACDLVLKHFYFQMNQEVIYANHFEYNDRSRHFITKYGMAFEGHWYSKKRECNNSIYHMTKDRFVAKRCNDE
jgi:RimJ/RimL family protein N-acetyltransferase